MMSNAPSDSPRGEPHGESHCECDVTRPPRKRNPPLGPQPDAAANQLRVQGCGAKGTGDQGPEGAEGRGLGVRGVMLPDSAVSSFLPIPPKRWILGLFLGRALREFSLWAMTKTV